MEVFVPPAPLRHQCGESGSKTTSYCVVLCCNLASVCVDICVRDGSFVRPAPLRYQCCESGNSTVYCGGRHSNCGKCVFPTIVNCVAGSRLFAQLISPYGTGIFVPPVPLRHQCSNSWPQHGPWWGYLLSNTGQLIAFPRWLIIVLGLFTSLVVLWFSILCRYCVSVPTLHCVLLPLFNRPLFPRVPSKLHCLFNAERPEAALVVHRLLRG